MIRLRHLRSEFTGRENTYSEIVNVVDGVAEVQKQVTANALLRRGYELIGESHAQPSEPASPLASGDRATESVTASPPVGEPSSKKKAKKTSKKKGE